MNPYLKSNASLYTYRLLLTILEHMSEDDNNRFLTKVIDYLSEYKKKLFESMEDDIESIQKILPMFHILKYALSYIPFSDKERMRALA